MVLPAFLLLLRSPDTSSSILHLRSGRIFLRLSGHSLGRHLFLLGGRPSEGRSGSKAGHCLPFCFFGRSRTSLRSLGCTEKITHVPDFQCSPLSIRMVLVLHFKRLVTR